MKGIVKTFLTEKGYGFIKAEDDKITGDIFVHFSKIEMFGFKKLEVGQRVSFDLEESDGKRQATNVQVVGA